MRHRPFAARWGAVLLAAALLAGLAAVVAPPARAQTPIPDDCQTWFDGCNTCARAPGGTLTCTQKKCAESAPAVCLRRRGERQAMPADCAVWFDGCNTCRRGDARTVICTRRYCSTRGPARCIRRTGETG